MPSFPGTYASTTSPQGARFSDILLWVRQELVDKTGIDESRVNILAERNPKPRQFAETNLRIRPLGRDVTPDPGGGRNADYKVRRFAVDVCTRLAVDYAGSDLEAIVKADVTVNEGLGQLGVEDLVLDAIDFRFATKTDPDNPNADPTRLTIQPVVEVTGVTDPEKPKPADGFTLSSLYFEAKYVQKYVVARN